jgi:hypothetical protein
MYISAEQLGENVDGAYRRHEAQDFDVLPLEFAAQHVVPVRLRARRNARAALRVPDLAAARIRRAARRAVCAWCSAHARSACKRLRSWMAHVS